MAGPVDNRASSLPSADRADLATPVGTPSTSAAAFPIVGIGASAGGLEACT
jgi:chemotaxis response regulator CheB